MSSCRRLHLAEGLPLFCVFPSTPMNFEDALKACWGPWQMMSLKLISGREHTMEANLIAPPWQVTGTPCGIPTQVWWQIPKFFFGPATQIFFLACSNYGASRTWEQFGDFQLSMWFSSCFTWLRVFFLTHGPKNKNRKQTFGICCKDLNQSLMYSTNTGIWCFWRNWEKEKSFLKELNYNGQRWNGSQPRKKMCWGVRKGVSMSTSGFTGNTRPRNDVDIELEKYAKLPEKEGKSIQPHWKSAWRDLLEWKTLI